MIRVAAFDLDGTILDGESPFILTTDLLKHRDMPLKTGIKMGIWGIKYRLRLKQHETTPRELLFSVLTDDTVRNVDDDIMDVYIKKIRKRIKPEARNEIEKCRAAGCKLILASASFKPITTAIVRDLGFDAQVCTIMEEENGHYTARVSGAPVQGAEKIKRLNALCDGLYGRGNWELEYAYGDHFSDIPMLSAARVAKAVDPDGFLKTFSMANGWEIVEWE